MAYNWRIPYGMAYPAGTSAALVVGMLTPYSTADAMHV